MSDKETKKHLEIEEDKHAKHSADKGQRTNTKAEIDHAKEKAKAPTTPFEPANGIGNKKGV